MNTLVVVFLLIDLHTDEGAEIMIQIRKYQMMKHQIKIHR